MKNILHRAVFLDRDGIINKKAKEHDYIKNWGEFEFLPHIADVISQLNKKFLVLVVSNQAGISRGLMTLDDVNSIHINMQSELEKSNAIIDKIYVCPHNIEDHCECRKPEAGMIFQAAKDFNIDLVNSYMVGDSISDIEAGRKAGCKTVLLQDAAFVGVEKPHFIVQNMLDLLDFIV